VVCCGQHAISGLRCCSTRFKLSVVVASGSGPGCQVLPQGRGAGPSRQVPTSASCLVAARWWDHIAPPRQLQPPLAMTLLIWPQVLAFACLPGRAPTKASSLTQASETTTFPPSLSNSTSVSPNNHKTSNPHASRPQHLESTDQLSAFVAGRSSPAFTMTLYYTLVCLPTAHARPRGGRSLLTGNRCLCS
jgi:hypothetical protein